MPDLARGLVWRVLAALGAIVGVIAGSIVRIRRAHVEAAMRLSGMDRGSASASAAKMYRGLGASLFEAAFMAWKRGEKAGSRASIEGTSALALDRAIAEGRGVVLASSHTGNWELAAAALAERVSFAAVAKRMSVPRIDRFVRRARAARGIDAIDRDGALSRGHAHLARGGMVAMMIDQVPDKRRHAIEVEFLGATAWVDRAPATLSARSGAPLVVAACSRDESGRARVDVLRVIEPPRVNRAAWIDAATRESTLALDAWVRAHPSDWLWMHRRWRAPIA